VVNFNDCQIAAPADLARVARLFGPPSLMLSQFSYAAWKGGKDDRAFREEAAKKKRDTLTMQTRVLHPQHALPFASFIYFSNVENAYLNDAMNTPRTAAATLAAAGTSPVVLYPGDEWEIGTPHDNEPALARYDQRLAELPRLPLRGPGETVGLAQLQEAFSGYRARMMAQNSRLLIALVRKLRFLGTFQPIAIRLTDLDVLISFSLLDGIEALPGGTADVAMHSSSLMFLLKNDFGYDTLTVNGRFECSTAGFAKMTRAFGIGSLNAMGISVAPSLVFNLRVLMILLGKLRQVMTRMRRHDAAQRGA